MTEAIAAGKTFSGEDAMKQMLRFASVEGLLRAGRQQVSILDDVPLQGPVFCSLQSVIFLYTRNTRVTLKSFFHEGCTRDFLARKLKRDRSVISVDIIRDSMGEIGNLTAGALKSLLTSAGEDCGMSLPIVTEGFDEILYPYAAQSDQLFDAWALNVDGTSTVIVLAYIGQDEKNSLNQLSWTVPSEGDGAETDDSDDMEFL